MNVLIQCKTTILPFLIASVLAGFGFLPKGEAVVPPPDGGYPGFTTAEGQNALQNLTTGVGNTAVGWFSLFSTTDGSFNTATGAGALLFNTANQNTAFGTAALLFNTTGQSNTGVGSAALLNNTTGPGNTATGARALTSNTIGIQNTANGSGALQLNTEGDNNTAVGSAALIVNTTGSQNTAVGSGALFANNSSDNTAVGFQSLFSNTTGDGNTAVGSHALQSNSGAPPHGSQNTAVGTEGLENNIDGSGNCAFGTLALENNVDGSANCAFGTFALNDNVNGGFNNAFGLNALGANVSGLRNTAIGYLAGEVITGSGNVCIGAEVAGEAGVDNSTYIRNVNTTVQSGGGFDTVTVRLADGRLGHAVSSRRYKEDIKPMDRASEALFALQPVMFRYKKQVNPEQGVDYGLIAEDVAKVAPELAVRDREGKISNYRHDAINAMLLNEFLKEHRKNEEQEKTIAELKSGMTVLAATVKEQAAQIQKVSAQVELSKPAPQTVKNTD